MKGGTVMGTEAEGRGGEAEGGPGRAEVTDHGARPKPAGAPAPPQRTGRAEGRNPFPVTCRRLWRWVLSSGQTMRTAEGGRGSGLGGILPEAGRGRARGGIFMPPSSAVLRYPLSRRRPQAHKSQMHGSRCKKRGKLYSLWCCFRADQAAL